MHPFAAPTPPPLGRTPTTTMMMMMITVPDFFIPLFFTLALIYM